MRPTALGVKAALFYVLLLAAFFAAPYANLFFLLLAFLTIQALTSYVSCRRNLSGVHAIVDELEPVPADSGAPVAVTVHGGKRTRFALGIRLELEPIRCDSIASFLEARLRGELLRDRVTVIH